MEHQRSPVEEHYFTEDIYGRIVKALHEQGVQRITRKNLAAIDEFHVRGAAVSLELAREAGFDSKSIVLDIGCGIGGPARMIADEFGCRVTGIDLTEEFIRTATLLSELVGLQHLTSFIVADALRLPFAPKSFTGAWTQHVQMNIENKYLFYSEIKRVLVPGGRFIYYDIFSTGRGDPEYPLPWAKDSSISHLFSIAAVENILLELGFVRIRTLDQTPEAITFFERLFERSAGEVSPQPGLNLLVGDRTGEKFANLLKALREGRLQIQSGIYDSGDQ